MNPIIIRDVKPVLDAGRYPIKREVGDQVHVSAEVFRHGHDRVLACVHYRKAGKKKWTSVPMTCVNAGLDLWEADFPVTEMGYYEYTIAACTDVYNSWLHDTEKKFKAGEDIESDLLEGRIILDDAKKSLTAKARKDLAKWMPKAGKKADLGKRVAEFSRPELVELMQENAHRLEPGLVCAEPVLKVWVDRVRARYASWYELFPRSAGKIEGRSATWKDVEERIPHIAAMGFDVLYFPPIHPIGQSFRKGANNSLISGPDDPGCPYAIGNENGGHFAVNEDLGPMKDFRHMVKIAAKHGIEIALDFAINCSYDHEYLKDHPDWFYRRPDGSIKYAENPPKKYEDIYPLNFDCEDKENLWSEMKRYFLFWAEQGVKTFRVDNPHTKPVEFWEKTIGSVHEKHPDIIFLAEAFTRPPMMAMLAKAGFQQSYTYFTWRVTKKELTEYLTELTSMPKGEFMRGNLFTNTPDILPWHLQDGPRAIFKIRFALAATLSSVYGMYSGFELCENTAIPGREEYLDSEKYEYKVWDWDRPGNIKDFITTVNHIRRDNPALQEYDNLRFHHADNDQVMAYSKVVDGNRILVVINLDPWNTQAAMVDINLSELGVHDGAPYTVRDLLTGEAYTWHGSRNYVELDPMRREPVHIFQVSQ